MTMIKRIYKKISIFLRVVKESKRPARYFFAQVLAKTGLCKFFVIKMKGYMLHFTPSSLSITLFSNPGDRDYDEAFFRHLLKQGDVYVDVGANIGTLALCAAQLVGAHGKVIAIEAHPKTFGYLTENVALNSFLNIELLNYAVGDKEGELTFSDINSDDQNKVMIGLTGGITVPVKKLDMLLSEENYISLLKIDVEGFEKFVVEGASEVLKRTDVVFFESWNQNFLDFGYTAGDLISLFELNGFKVFSIIDDKLSIISRIYSSEKCENLLAIKNTEQFSFKTGINL
jgi:FkbM family methyltransferase